MPIGVNVRLDHHWFSHRTFDGIFSAINFRLETLDDNAPQNQSQDAQKDDDPVAHLRELMEKSSLEGVFAQLTQPEDTDAVARKILDVVTAA